MDTSNLWFYWISITLCRRTWGSLLFEGCVGEAILKLSLGSMDLNELWGNIGIKKKIMFGHDITIEKFEAPSRRFQFDLSFRGWVIFWIITNRIFIEHCHWFIKFLTFTPIQLRRSLFSLTYILINKFHSFPYQL